MVFISNLKIKIRKGLVIIFDSMCMHYKRQVTITLKFVTYEVILYSKRWDNHELY